LKKIGVLVSGSGSNLQAIIDATTNGMINGKVGVVVSNKPGVLALERAFKSDIPAVVIDHRLHSTTGEFSRAILTCMRDHEIDLICLAGFLRILDRLLIEPYLNRIINIHPALLPAFGGKGMYGHFVHEAVITSGVKYSGATVHFVTAETDVGPIIAQGVVPVADDDTPDSLAAKVLQVEHRIYPEAVKLVLEEQVEVEGLRVKKKR
jgi:phosphoribosylglycinamide formyltransferase 1